MAGDIDRWVKIQQNTFTNWVNENLRVLDLHVDNLESEFCDGVRLCALMEVLCKRSIGKVIKKPFNHHHNLENITLALHAISNDGIRLVNIGPEDILNSNLKLILGMIWLLIRHYQIGTSSDAKVPPKKLMLAWVRAVIPDCNINNFSTDWNDGIALHGLIEYCRPGTCPDWKNLRFKDKSSLSSRLQNAENGMRLAKEYLGVPMVLSPENLSSYDLDELSGMTYISYFLKVESPGYYATLIWVQQKISPRPVINFDKDWNDGSVLAALVTACGGNLQHQHQVDASDWIASCQRGMDAASELGVEPVISAKEMADEGVDHIGVMAYAARFQAVEPAPPPVPVKRQSLDVVMPETNCVGGSASFNIRGQIDSGSVRAEAHSPSGRVEYISITSSPDDTVTCDFRPTEVGRWAIKIFHDNSEVLESPFYMEIYDASQVFILGLESGLVLQQVRFTVDCSRAGKSSLDVLVSIDNEIVKTSVTERGGALYDVDFMPTTAGSYNVNVYFGGAEVSGSPFTVNILDMDNVYATGSGLSEVKTGKAAAFTINAVSSPGRDISVQIVAPTLENLPFELVKNEDSTYTVSYTPVEPGDYLIEVLYDRNQINGSPFRVRAVEPHVVVTNYTPEIFTGEEATLNVDGSDVGKGSIEIEINDGQVKVKEVTPNPNNNRIYDVTFIPEKEGQYCVCMKYKDVPVPGSPWFVNAKDYIPDAAPYTTAPRLVNTINV